MWEGAPYSGFFEATVATGGQLLSICTPDYAELMDSLGVAVAATVFTDSFYLTGIPVPATIEVVVDDVTVTTGWSYDSDDNTIVFEEPHVPDANSTIEVSYGRYGDCDD